MKLAIDPGHGMSNRQMGVYDPGGEHLEAGVSFQEAEIALRYALSLRDALRSRGSAVFLTREDARDHAPLARRAANAKSAGAELLISLHLNSVEDDRANGLEVLYRSDASRPLAQALQRALVAVTKFRDRGVKRRDDLAVLRFAGPAVLIELGFLGHDGDREVVIDPARRHAICETIAETTLAHAAPARSEAPPSEVRAPGKAGARRARPRSRGA
jgi:N-acetylmuramoyl-L-alanine amidase